MKKSYKFLLVLLAVLFTSGVVSSQTLLYEDDFESYTTGGYVAEQNPDWWITWSGGTGGGEDGIISEAFSHSPIKSVLIDETGGATDLLWLLGDKTSDIYNVSFWMYIPSGFCGYYNFQHFEAPGVEWAIEMYFHTDGTTRFVIAGDDIVMNYNHDTWFYMEHIIDLDAEIAQAYIDGVLITEWLWSMQSSGAAGANQLGAVDFFAGAEGADTPKYYFDDVRYTQGNIPPGPIITVDPNHFDVSLEIGQTQTNGLTIGNEGEEDLIYAISIEYTDDDWLMVNPTSGTVIPGEADINDVSFDATGLDAGTYYATIVIESNDILNPVVDIPVSLTVMAVPHFNFEGGDPSSPLWTIYIGGAMLEGADLVPGDEIGIFDGDLLVGAIILDQVCTPENQFENDLTAFSVLVSTPGYQGGNPYFFKCWDASEELEVASFEIELFNPYGDAYIGDVFPLDDGEYSIVALDFLSGASQTFNLSFGFQFISSAVDPVDPDMLIVMADVLNDNLDFARNSQGQTLRKIGPNWVNGIGDWVIDEGYLVKMYADDSFTITGSSIMPSTPIPVEAGFQFVSYFPSDPINALDAFATIIGDNLDFVRNSQGQTLRKIGPNWVNGIGDCQLGEGYLVKMFADGEIIYPVWAKSSGKTLILPTNFIFDRGNPAKEVYTMYIDGLEIGDEVAAYNGNVMVGATKIISQDAFENELPVFSALINGQGYVSGMPITLKVCSNNNIVSSSFTMEPVYDSYVSNVYPAEDGKYSIVNITKSSFDEAEGRIRIFPNPASDIINITSSYEIQKISIFNFIGQSVYFGNEIQINTNNFEAGVYIVKIETVNGIETQKITIK
ncbi:MAG: T9SS type A sorting domain-containing protein [Bacteroidales bacterium]|nr:T9SS type A sorting domain-containing protein [Bacteroidales bacterium]